MHWHEALTVAVVVICGVLLIATASAWRRAISDSPNLPMWRFLRRNGTTRDDATDTLSGRAVMQVVLSCALCGSRQQCRERLAAGAAAPPADCPNARFLDEFSLRTGAGDVTGVRHPQRPTRAPDVTTSRRSKAPKPAL